MYFCAEQDSIDFGPALFSFGGRIWQACKSTLWLCRKKGDQNVYPYTRNPLIYHRKVSTPDCRSEGRWTSVERWPQRSEDENVTTKAIKCDMIFTSEYGQGGMNPCICDRWDLTLEWIRRYYEGITDKESIARMGPGDWQTVFRYVCRLAAIVISFSCRTASLKTIILSECGSH